MTQKSIDDMMRASYLKDLVEFLDEKYGCDVCQTAAGTVMIPCLDSTGEERWVKFSVIVPKDASEEAGTDGYSLEREYRLKLDAAVERKAKAAAKAAKAKAKKSE